VQGRVIAAALPAGSAQRPSPCPAAVRTTNGCQHRAGMRFSASQPPALWVFGASQAFLSLISVAKSLLGGEAVLLPAEVAAVLFTSSSFQES